MEYRERFGPFNQPLRIEAAIARAVAPFLKNAKARDLMVWPKEDEPEASIEGVFGLIKSAASSTKRK